MEKDIEFTLAEKQMLINQFQILQKLSDNEYEAKEYENKIKILERGYKYHYSDIVEHIYLDESSMTKEQSIEVLDILRMFRGIIYSFKALKRSGKLTKLTEDQVRFIGFDGTHESKQMLYTYYFIEDLDRYSEIQELSNSDYNSHCRMLDIYRSMLSIWEQYRETLDNPYSMTEDQICNLVKNYNPY